MSDPDPAAPAPRTLNVIFCVDCSGSMAGERIGAVNAALRSILPALRRAAEGDPGVEILARVLAFADKPQWRVAGEMSQLVAGGETNLGLALRELGEALSSIDALTPAVAILVSDGLPTDDGEAGLAAFARRPHAAEALRIAVAVGSDADIDLLQAFGARLPPLLAHNPAMLRGQIEWATAALVTAAASPAGVEMQALAAAAARRNEQIGERLW
ncbi:MAG: VWA domain-containing protein [Pseudomonadota bacterium]|nr:VWA domain-containing protein [Pseudomonadota bacterium]